MGDKYNWDALQVKGRVPPPRLDYLPPSPMFYQPSIGLIGCGAISAYHLAAYKEAGFRVVALCDKELDRAQDRRAEFFPQAEVFSNYQDLLRLEHLDVVDIATHPHERHVIIEQALMARKHVLSQKPFVLDLRDGAHLVDLAARNGVQLAVNQSGCWAPHYSYIREAIRTGLLGDVISVHLNAHWNYDGEDDITQDDVRHSILFDFGIHRFDVLSSFMGENEPRRVFASLKYAPYQKKKAPLLAEVIVEYDEAQATIVFDGATRFASIDNTIVTGTQATITSSGSDLNDQSVTFYTENGIAVPPLEGNWFANGFRGSMAELICAIESNRPPLNHARNNLRGLALCFAAIASAETGESVQPGAFFTLPER